MTSNSNDKGLGRRRFLAGLGGAAGLGAAGLGALGAGMSARRRANAGFRDHEAGHDPAQALAERKLLFVVCAAGGGSIIDSFLPVLDTEVVNGEPASLDVYPESLIRQPEGSNIRCLGNLSNTSYFTPTFSMEGFLQNHYSDTVVLTHENTSVNHEVAQRRAVTGAGIDSGRTILEAAALRHGSDLLLPNCAMATGGYIAPGTDASLPRWARGEIVADPLMFASSTHGYRGVLGAPDAALIERARGVRRQLDDASPFGQTFRDSPLRQQYLSLRDENQAGVEVADLISKLMLVPQDALPSKFGLESSPIVDLVRETFPSMYTDPWQAKAALSFALAYFGVSCAVSLSVDFEPVGTTSSLISTPLAFDYSHNDHRVAQNIMWGRVCLVLDGLIRLLKSSDYLGDPALGKMWDRSLVYVATDFGREKIRPFNSGSYGTGHHLNNGSLLISPLLKGNQVFGGIDPDTLLTYGFDRDSGAPEPGSLMREGDVYSAVAQALDIEFTQRRDMSAMMKA